MAPSDIWRELGRRRGRLCLGLIAGLSLAAGLSFSAGADDAMQPVPALPAAALTPAETAALDKLALPLPSPAFGDFDAMKTQRQIRVLVCNSRTRYFINKGQELGVDAEYARAFEAAINRKYKTGALKIHVALIPVARDKLLSELVAGLGDIAMAALTVTPERLTQVDFAAPMRSDVREVVVTGTSGPKLQQLDDLAGQAIFVRPSSSYYAHLQSLSDSLVQRGLQPITLTPAAEDLEDEDLLEMVNAGLLPIVVVDDYRARFWAQVYTKIAVREDLVVNEGGNIAWAIRKGSPLLTAEINAFMQDHRVGTSFGNTVAQRYLKSTKALTDAYSPQQLQRFQQLVGIFQTYATAYKFNDLMLMAQGYQESELDQSRRSTRGAVGIMQILPATAAGDPIGITGVESSAAKNIEAGAKYMALLRDTYLDDPAIDDKNKTLMTFAAYNAGPGNLAKFRHLAEKSGLDPNIWFNNVELAAARVAGRQTVDYVSNIYKYYIAYELIRQSEEKRASAKANLGATTAP